MIEKIKTLNFRLSDDEINYCTSDLVSNFKTYVYSKIFDDNNSIVYLKLVN